MIDDGGYVKVASHKLKSETSVKTKYEELFKQALIDANIPAFYEVASFPVEEVKNGRSYLPDFITALFIKGKEVVIEPHASPLIDIRYLEKIDGFRKNFNFYLVLVSDTQMEELNSRIGVEILNFVDAFWFVEEENLSYRWEEKEKEVVSKLLELKSQATQKSESEVINNIYPKIKKAERVKEEVEKLKSYKEAKRH
ncbi:MAG: hypothetical protein ACP5GB_00290 [Candidatus Micrarchaeia archaeon]|jgi:hypothetical protein